jgi:hypothetical protein
MKLVLLSLCCLFSVLFCSGQNGQVNNLPAGKYETVVKSSQIKWERGDIILLDENKYKISTSNEVGEYRFSVAAQRIFFTSGPLKNMFAKASASNNTPSIILPAAENAQSGLNSEIVCYLRQ